MVGSRRGDTVTYCLMVGGSYANCLITCGGISCHTRSRRSKADLRRICCGLGGGCPAPGEQGGPRRAHRATAGAGGETDACVAPRPNFIVTYGVRGALRAERPPHPGQSCPPPRGREVAGS
jgi:hypothetical protein